MEKKEGTIVRALCDTLKPEICSAALPFSAPRLYKENNETQLWKMDDGNLNVNVTVTVVIIIWD
jgi:hypothetical protein